MPNFNKLRFIVFEIYDNSQLFLTDPRIRCTVQIKPGSGIYHLLLRQQGTKNCQASIVMIYACSFFIPTKYSQIVVIIYQAYVYPKISLYCNILVFMILYE